MPIPESTPRGTHDITRSIARAVITGDVTFLSLSNVFDKLKATASGEPNIPLRTVETLKRTITGRESDVLGPKSIATEGTSGAKIAAPRVNRG